MGLTKRGKDWYIEFPVIDDGKTLKLAPYGSRSLPGFKMKRWKAGRYKEQAERIEAQKRQELETGLVRSENLPGPVTFKALTEGYLTLTNRASRSSQTTRARKRGSNRGSGLALVTEAD